MFKTIVWATDGSDAADEALSIVAGLAERDGAWVLVVHARELSLGRGGGYPVHVDEDALLDKIRGQVAELKNHGIDARLEVTTTTSSAGHVIADHAKAANADLVVVATRGHSPIAGLLLGSVTQRLLHIAPCPVLAVPVPHRGPNRPAGRPAEAEPPR